MKKKSLFRQKLNKYRKLYEYIALSFLYLFKTFINIFSYLYIYMFFMTRESPTHYKDYPKSLTQWFYCYS